MEFICCFSFLFFEKKKISEILTCVPVSPLPTPNMLDLSANSERPSSTEG